jgi:hypothetical protein
MSLAKTVNINMQRLHLWSENRASTGVMLAVRCPQSMPLKLFNVSDAYFY